MNKLKYLLLTVLLAMLFALVACGGGEEPAAAEPAAAEEPAAEEMEEEMAEEGMEEEMGGMECEELTPVTLQLQWFTQSQFAGYFAAKDMGFYENHCLDVTILEGAVEIVPQQVVASGEAEFGIAWLPKMLASREQGADLVSIGQVFQRSGTVQVGWADNPELAEVENWAGKRVGTWGFGNEFEVFAALRKAGIEPDDPDQVTIVQQPFDMSLLLNRELDMAQAETYNEYAQLLEATNPETGELYQPEDFLVVDYNDVGTAMLQDQIFVTESWLADNEDIAISFLAASFEGWIYCRDNPESCVEIVLNNGPALGESHMTWMMNEINALIWPSPAGIGVMDADLYQQTVDISTDFGVLENAPDEGAYRTDLAEEALTHIGDLDAVGEDFTRIEVELRPGGE